MRIEDIAATELARRRAAGLTRTLRTVGGMQDRWVDVDGRRALLLCSNNYLGLANHPAVCAAAARAAQDYGVGAGASRLISGSMRLHAALEEAIAAFKGTERALLFTSGYHANIGVIAALVGAGDTVFSDALNHASIIDGCRLSGARVRVYPHGDVAALDELLACAGHGGDGRRLVVTDAVFSMDGDSAPLPAICDVAERHGVMVMVDEAHATGVLGPTGAGLVERDGLRERVAVQMGTLGKALGTFGAYVAGSAALIELLVNTARSFIYTTALPPPAVAAAHAALLLVQSEPQRRAQLLANAGQLHGALAARGFQVPEAPSHILPVRIGEADQTMRWSEGLLRAGVFVQGIRPPTVPAGTARLRVTPMSTHTADDLAAALNAFDHVAAELR